MYVCLVVYSGRKSEFTYKLKRVCCILSVYVILESHIKIIPQQRRRQATEGLRWGGRLLVIIKRFHVIDLFYYISYCIDRESFIFNGTR